MRSGCWTLAGNFWIPFKPWMTSCMSHSLSIHHAPSYVSPTPWACCSQPKWMPELKNVHLDPPKEHRSKISEVKYHHDGKELHFYLHKFGSVTNLSHLKYFLPIFIIRDGNVCHAQLAFHTHLWCSPRSFSLLAEFTLPTKLSEKQICHLWFFCTWMLLDLRLELITPGCLPAECQSFSLQFQLGATAGSYCGLLSCFQAKCISLWVLLLTN